MEHHSIVLIPVEEINILNPRVRNRIIAEEIQQNIKTVGLKRPITVSPREDNKNGKKYDLVCGQGRLEAFLAAGEREIPAIIRDVSKEDAHIMSLVENIARRNNSSLELLHSIKALKKAGYDDEAIASKTSLGKDYISDIIRLLDNGEEYLVNAVEKGRLPLYHALSIATEKDTVVQKTLVDAYESGDISGKKLLAMQKIISRRKHYGKSLSTPQSKGSEMTQEELLLAFEQGIKEKKQLISQSNYVKNMLSYTTAALNKLLADIHFTNQLKAVGITEIPQHIAEIIKR